MNLLRTRCATSSRERGGRREFDGAGEDRVEHRLGQASGERVLLARVERTQQRDRTEMSAGSVPATCSRTSTPWPNFGRGRTPKCRARRLVAERPEAHDRPGRSAAPRTHAPGTARTVSRSDGSGLLSGGAHFTAAVTHASVSCEPVVERRRRRLVREAGPVHRPEQPVAAAVAGEHPAGAVRAVRGRRQTEHHDPCVRVAEAGDRPTPVRPRRGTTPASPPPTCSRHATRRGQARQSTTSAARRARATHETRQ